MACPGRPVKVLIFQHLHMTVIEYRPGLASGQRKQPDCLSDKPSFKSRRLGRVVSTAGVHHLSWEEVDELFHELTEEIQTLGSRMCSQLWSKQEHRRMKSKKARWGAVHQALCQRRSIRAKARKVRKASERSFAHLFQDIAREELPEELYTRLQENAKERYAEALIELANLRSEGIPLD